MRQEEFLMSFQEALTGEVSDRIIQENVNYYRRYINREMQTGKPEEEILQALGSPRLLAKTIIESNKFVQEEQGAESTYSSGQRDYGSQYSNGFYNSAFSNHYGNRSYNNANSNSNGYNNSYNYYHNGTRKQEGKHKAIQISSWLLAIAGIFVMAFLIGLAFCVISYLLPVMLFFAGIMLICRVVRKVVRGY